MNWIKEFVTPKIKAFIGGSKVEDNLWTKCPSCDKMLYNKELAENDMVCGNCSHHFAIKPDLRFKQIFDNSQFEEIESVKVKDDPIKFKDSKKYTDRLKEARQKTNKQDAACVSFGKIGEKNAVIFVMDFSFMGGSMGLSVGKSFVKAVNFAIENKSALVSFTSSGGARMQEGMFSLMQMPATVAALCALKEAALPFINVFTHPTTGGVLASFSMLGDINISEPKALIGFAGARVIENTIKQKLPQGFQKAEFLKDHGMIDRIVHRNNLKKELQTILSLLMR